ncbi:uncharacterized protein PAC_00890 [Phialocephala subalpina]|uniref:Formyl transferase C-terminal domain-containing protein n=1 Tax=Phialocephala subalpina TaxID=576137 RepID=A0A1L7WE12_9HELO|nr:uncharacterized protein PAC_00890 [Phialocephala subalpina]
MSAVVFGYHNVGVNFLSVLLGINIRLVVPHADSPSENIWLNSVAGLAAEHDIPVVAPKNLPQRRNHEAPSGPHARLPLLACYNMNGSLLPRYRGRVPVSWAVLHGETQIDWSIPTCRDTDMDLSPGSCFSGRSAEDGRIDWSDSAAKAHNLVRNVMHPYPGPFADTAKGRLVLWRTMICDEIDGALVKAIDETVIL